MNDTTQDEVTRIELEISRLQEHSRRLEEERTLAGSQEAIVNSLEGIDRAALDDMVDMIARRDAVQQMISHLQEAVNRLKEQKSEILHMRLAVEGEAIQRKALARYKDLRGQYISDYKQIATAKNPELLHARSSELFEASRAAHVVADVRELFADLDASGKPRAHELIGRY